MIVIPLFTLFTCKDSFGYPVSSLFMYDSLCHACIYLPLGCEEKGERAQGNGTWDKQTRKGMCLTISEWLDSSLLLLASYMNTC